MSHKNNRRTGFSAILTALFANHIIMADDETIVADPATAPAETPVEETPTETTTEETTPVVEETPTV